LLFPTLTGSILGAAESSGAKLVFADNLYAYGPVDGPLREDLPAAARGRKGRTGRKWPPSCSARTATAGRGS
jgi:hypothetical protein